MNNRLKSIVFKEINHRHKNERNFYENILNIKKHQWKYWKRNDYTLIELEDIIINKLFTPYEWSLANWVCEEYKNGIGITSYYDAYLDVKIEKMISFLDSANRVAVKDIDPNQKHAEPKYRVPKIRIYVESLLDENKGNIVTLIIYGKSIEDLPARHRFLKRWILALSEEEILRGV